jgi:hypothetical protein
MGSIHLYTRPKVDRNQSRTGVIDPYEIWDEFTHPAPRCRGRVQEYVLGFQQHR